MNKPIWPAFLGWGQRNISGLVSLTWRTQALSGGPMVKPSPSHTGMQQCLVGAMTVDGGCSLQSWSLFGFALAMSSEFYALSFQYILQELSVVKIHLLMSKEQFELQFFIRISDIPTRKINLLAHLQKDQNLENGFLPHKQELQAAPETIPHSSL